MAQKTQLLTLPEGWYLNFYQSPISKQFEELLESLTVHAPVMKIKEVIFFYQEQTDTYSVRIESDKVTSLIVERFIAEITSVAVISHLSACTDPEEKFGLTLALDFKFFID